MRTCENFRCESSSTAADDDTSHFTLFGCSCPFLMYIAHEALLERT